ncbi:hypothetical protein Tco_0085447 [Tanacetum coccineum]
MTTLGDKAILSGADNRPPMLEKDMYDSWKIKMEQYMMNRQHGRMILESVENGPLIWPSIEENRVTRPKKYYELSTTEENQADCDIDATNIILQGLPLEKGNDPIDAINHMMSFLTDVVTSRYPTTNNQGRQTSLAVGTTRTYTPGESGSNSRKQRTDKVLLVKAQANGQILYEEELAFLADPGIAEDTLAEYVIELQQAAVQNSNSSAQQDALTLSVIEQLKTQVVNYTKINLDNKSVNDTLTAEIERYKEQVKVLKEGQNVDLRSNDNILDSSVQSVEIDRLKQTLSEHLKEKESLMQTVTLLKDDFKKEESRNIDREIALEKRIKQLDNIVFKRDQSAQTVHMLTKPQFFYDHTTKQALGFQNPFYLKKAQQLEPKLYDGNVIKNTSAIVIPDSEETLMLAEESRSKMLLKQKDPMMFEKKVNTKPVDYVVLNQLSQDFETRFVPQTELSAEQAFCSQNSVNSPESTLSSRPTKVEVPKELPKVSMVNTSLKKLKHHLAGFDVVVKERTTTTAITEGSWGFEHTKACFRDEIIPFVKALNDLFNTFDQYLINELSEVQNVFHQMEQAVEQHRLESKTFEVKMNKVLNENERPLEQVISQDIVNIIVNSSMDNASVKGHECEKENYVSNQSALSFDQLFELNELKAQSQEEDMAIKKLKERIKSLSGKMNEDKIKKDLEEIETINIELDHRVSKLIAENEHLKQTYKQLYDSIKPARIRSKEQCEGLINQVNLKSVEISDLNARLQEQVLVITALKDDLRKVKGKALVDKAITKHTITKHTIDPEMLKIDVEYLNHRLLNNRSAHSDYLKHTQEEVMILREIVEQRKSQNPLNESLDSACKYTKQIQELLIIVGQTCPSINNSDKKLVVVTPKNKDKRVRFTKLVISSRDTNTKISSSSNLVSNKPMLSSTGVKPSTSASESQPSGNIKKDKIQHTPSRTQKNKVEAHHRKVKSSLKNKECVVAPKGSANVQHSKLNANSELKCVKCNGCMLTDNHDLCVLDFINNVNARRKSKSVKKNSKRKVWKPTGKVFTNIGYTWRPTGRTFTIVANVCPSTRITTTTEVPLRKPTALENETPKPVVTLVYSRKPKKSKTNVHVSKSKVIKSVYANKEEPSPSWGSIVSDVPSSSLDECRYGDYQIGNVTISRVYCVEGLRHNLFSVGQLCASNLEVAFCQHTCFIRNLEGVDLLTGSRGNNLYTPSLIDMMVSFPICLLSNASKTKLNTSTGNPVKEILLNLNLPDHRSILTDLKMEVKAILQTKQFFRWLDNRPTYVGKYHGRFLKSRMELYMMNRQHGRMILESVENGILIWPSIKENGVTRPKKYSELSVTEAIQADCDIKATNIILQGLPPEVYALVSNHKVAKELWEIIQLLMQGNSLTKQERECKLYDEFDKFTYKKGETLRDFYLRFSLLLNDMNIYNMKLEQFQVNTKFLNTLPPEWSKFMTDVKLV